MKQAILHNLDNPRPQRFKYLAQALRRAWETKATGYIVTPADEIINIKKGKRPPARGTKWVPCSQ